MKDLTEISRLRLHVLCGRRPRTPRRYSWCEEDLRDEEDSSGDNLVELVSMGYHYQQRFCFDRRKGVSQRPGGVFGQGVEDARVLGLGWEGKVEEQVRGGQHALLVLVRRRRKEAASLL
jgi:hypothetical protein